MYHLESPEAHSSLWDGLAVLEGIVGTRVSLMNTSQAERQLAVPISEARQSEGSKVGWLMMLERWLMVVDDGRSWLVEVG